MSRRVSHLQAISFAIAAFTCWVVADCSIKLGADAGVPPNEIIFVFALIGTGLIFLKAWRGKGLQILKPKNTRNQLVSSALVLGINLFNVVALKHLPFTLFYISVFTAPMVIAILGARFLREHLTLGKSLAIIAGFAGVVIAINPFSTESGGLHGDWIGYAGAAGAVSCFASSIVLQRVILQSEGTDSLAFTQTLFMTIICGVMTLFGSVPLSSTTLLILCGGGVINIVGTVCGLTASKHTAAATVGQFQYTQIISGALLGYALWHEMPTLNLVGGSVIIIASGLYIANHARKAQTGVGVKTP